ncbi:hypothetical protein NN561_016009 [Cricetulus griseus]
MEGLRRGTGAMDSGNCSQSRGEAPWPERNCMRHSGEKTPDVSTEGGVETTLTETRDSSPELQTQERESGEQEKANDATRSHGAKVPPGAAPAPSGRAFRRGWSDGLAPQAMWAKVLLGPKAAAWAGWDKLL